MFFKGSRYEDVEDGELKDSTGREIRFKKIRFIPKTKGQVVHTVNEGERLDHIANQYYRNPERFWRICDANEAMKPEELVEEPGKKIVIPRSGD
jgi:nucleoid-associated protein YgaU